MLIATTSQNKRFGGRVKRDIKKCMNIIKVRI